MIQLQKAKRSLARIKLAVGGPSGSGKTMSSLLLAYGLVRSEHPDWTPAQCWEKICIIDTENGSACLYVGSSVGSSQIGEYYTIPLAAPYEPDKYTDALHAAEEAGMSVIIIDSYSHSWVGSGGALDKVGKIAARTGNSYTAWRDVTPEQTRMMDAILQSTCHVICTIRAKTEYVQEKVNGKTVVRNIGMGLQIRDSSDYDFSTVFMLDQDHVANTTKDRTGLFDGKYFTITPETGKEIYRWLSTGAPTQPENPPSPVKADPDAAPTPTEPAVTVEELDKVVKARCEGLTPEEKRAIGEEIKAIAGTPNYFKITDPAVLKAVFDHFTGT